MVFIFIFSHPGFISLSLKRDILIIGFLFFFFLPNLRHFIVQPFLLIQYNLRARVRSGFECLLHLLRERYYFLKSVFSSVRCCEN